jgi:2-aminoethylphosphonate-pyruvate transaminase
VVLRAYKLPQGVTYEQLHDGLKTRGFVIYAGQGGLSAQLFRISTMGAITPVDSDRLVDGFKALTQR